MNRYSVKLWIGVALLLGFAGGTSFFGGFVGASPAATSAIHINLSGEPFDASALSAEVSRQIFGELRDEYAKGPYTIRFYQLDDGGEYAEVRRGDEVLWFETSHRLSLPDDGFFNVLEPGLEHITGEGHADLLIVEYTGGAHCCTFVHVLQLEPEFRDHDIVLGLHNNPYFSDLDGDGIVEVTVRDWVFAYWKTSFAQSPAPRVVLQFDGERFRVAPDHMRTDAPGAGQFASTAQAVRTDDAWTSQKSLQDVFVEPPPRLWGVMLDLIYTGHWPLAFQFLDLAWPDDVAGKDVFARDFVQQLRSSVYWHDLWQEMYAGADLPFLE